MRHRKQDRIATIANPADIIAPVLGVIVCFLVKVLMEMTDQIDGNALMAISFTCAIAAAYYSHKIITTSFVKSMEADGWELYSETTED